MSVILFGGVLVLLGVDYSMWSVPVRQTEKGHICAKRHNFNMNAHVFVGLLYLYPGYYFSLMSCECHFTIHMLQFVLSALNLQQKLQNLSKSVEQKLFYEIIIHIEKSGDSCFELEMGKVLFVFIETIVFRCPWLQASWIRRYEAINIHRS